MFSYTIWYHTTAFLSTWRVICKDRKKTVSCLIAEACADNGCDFEVLHHQQFPKNRDFSNDKSKYKRSEYRQHNLYHQKLRCCNRPEISQQSPRDIKKNHMAPVYAEHKLRKPFYMDGLHQTVNFRFFKQCTDEYDKGSGAKIVVKAVSDVKRRFNRFGRRRRR